MTQLLAEQRKPFFTPSRQSAKKRLHFHLRSLLLRRVLRA